MFVFNLLLFMLGGDKAQFSFFSSTEHKLVMVGLDNAGKTTILYQFLMNEVVHTSPTIGSNVEEVSKEICFQTNVFLQFGVCL